MSKEMLFRTQVKMESVGGRFRLSDRFVFLGSCFSEHIGTRFAQYGLPVLSNPMGVLYNPKSISTVVAHALQPDAAVLPFFEHSGKWACWWTDTHFSAPLKEACEAQVQSAFDSLRNALLTSTCLFVTLGTPVVYQLRDNGVTVANCHKVPSNLFMERRMDVSDCVLAMEQMLATLWAANPGIRVVFTVSPYRYAKYGFHGNQLAKATLLLAVDELCRKHDACSYLPVYEIFMDELRDYRFYASDMLHPGEVAVDYIWHRLKTECMDEGLQQYLTVMEPICRTLLHRPTDSLSPKHQALLEKTGMQINQLREKYGLPVEDFFQT